MIRLPKLPDRNPIKLAITLSPNLHENLREYAAIYAQEYGVEEPVTELIPPMLATFLDGDRAFQKLRGRRDGRASPTGPAPAGETA